MAEADLRRSGVKAAVAPAIRAAWQTAVELEASPLRDDIETVARRARIALSEPADVTAEPPPSEAAVPPVRPAAHGLSAREIEVLRLVAAGRSNGEIGDELFITRKTAGVHVTHILDKLGVSNRVEAAMAAARLGLIEDVIGDADGVAAARPTRTG
jgi:DNA-binding NarL/FixJ family response regulator